MSECRNCGQTFNTIDSDAGRFTTYCSRDCELEFADSGLSDEEALHSVQPACLEDSLP